MSLGYNPFSGWVEVQELNPPDGEGGDKFGDAVSFHNNVLAVGAFIHMHPRVFGSGAIYTWRKSNDVWAFEQEIPPQELVAGFGRLVTVDGNRLITGGTLLDPICDEVYIFEFNGNSWLHQQTLFFPTDIGFGSSIAINGDVLVVGAQFDNSECGDVEECCYEVDGELFCDPLEGCGLVFVYRWSGEQWLQEQALAPSNPGFFRWFGRAVAVDGNTIVATARLPAAAHVFEYDESAGQWAETAILTSPLAMAFGERPRSVAVQGDTILIGDDVTSGGNTPRAFVFQRKPDGSWFERAVLWPDPNPWTSFFGWSVRLQGDRAIIGAYGEDFQQGAAYIYDLNPKPGDLTCDGTVGVNDLLKLLASWGECPAPGEGISGCPGDLNGDGTVGVADLLILLANWG